MLVPEHPYPDRSLVKIIEEVIGKAVEIAAPQTARIKVKKPRVSVNLDHRNLELREEVISQLSRDIVVFLQD